MAAGLLALPVSEGESGPTGLAGPLGIFGALLVGEVGEVGEDAAAVESDLDVVDATEEEMADEETEDCPASVCDEAENGGAGS